MNAPRRLNAVEALEDAVLIVFVLATTLYDAYVPVADNDLWGHVTFGRRILAEGRLPLTNDYAYTAPAHPWINHEILAECAFASAFDRFGTAGLIGLKLAIATATFAILTRMIRHRTRSLAATGVALGIGGALLSPGFLIRPQLFTFLAMAWVWSRIDRYDDTRDGRVLLSLPAVFALWINTHGGVIAGLAIFLAYVGLRVIAAKDPRERAILAGIALLSSLALLVNPYGAGLLEFLYRDLQLVRAISEWQALDLSSFAGRILLLALLLLMIGTAARPSRRPWEVFLILTAALMALHHQRHLPLFAIIATPRLAESLKAAGVWVRDRAGIPPLSVGARVAFAAGFGALALFQIERAHAMGRGLGAGIFVSPTEYPIDAVRFIRQNGMKGNLALPSDWGEYAIWHLHPDCRVAVDGRYTTAYPDDLLELSERFQFGRPGWQQFLHGADLVLVDRRQPIVQAMFRETEWRYVYSDATALVFVRGDDRIDHPYVREARTETQRAFRFP